jgi:DinB superfamily
LQRPFNAEEIERALKLLDWSRADLLKVINGLDEEKLNQAYPGERWPINGILRHMGGAEWWYMERLGRAFPQTELPKQTMERLEKVRQAFVALLPTLEGVKQVAGLEGELWSPRKALRRALWHERDHTEHIRKLL